MLYFACRYAKEIFLDIHIKLFGNLQLQSLCGYDELRYIYRFKTLHYRVNAHFHELLDSCKIFKIEAILANKAVFSVLYPTWCGPLQPCFGQTLIKQPSKVTLKSIENGYWFFMYSLNILYHDVFETAARRVA